MLDGSTLVGLGCPAEGVDAGGNRPFGGSLRGSHMALRRRKPLTGCLPGRIALAQLVHPRVDSADTLPDLLAAAPPGLWLVPHTRSMAAANG
jgi:hypothetical protein